MVVIHFRMVCCLKVRLLMAIALFSPAFVIAQDPGESLFKASCMVCHTIGGGRLVGPDLKGVNTKYEEEWLIKFIQSSQSMVSTGDERAIKIFKEFLVPMPDHSISDDQAKEVLSYIKNQGNPVELATEKITENFSKSNLTPQINTDFNFRNISYFDVVLLSVMGIEMITVLILISIVLVLLKMVKT